LQELKRRGSVVSAVGAVIGDVAEEVMNG